MATPTPVFSATAADRCDVTPHRPEDIMYDIKNALAMFDPTALLADGVTPGGIGADNLKAAVVPNLSGLYNVESYGVVGDGATDDTAALAAAGAACLAAQGSLYAAPDLNLKITAMVDLKGIRFVDFRATITSYVDHAICIDAGYNSASTDSVYLYFAEIVKGNALNADDIGLRLSGLKNAEVHIQKCYYLQLYANAAVPTQTSIAYSQFHFGKIDALELYGAAGLSWINENNFFGGRFTTIHIGNAGAGYPHGNNVFYKPCMEAGEFHVIKGVRNRVYDARTEGVCAVTFDAGTYRNAFIDNYPSNPGNLLGWGVVTDNGFENFYTTTAEMGLVPVPLISLDMNTPILDSSCAYAVTNVIPGLVKHHIHAWQMLFDVTVPVTQMKRFYFLSDATLWRPYCQVFDANMVALDGALATYVLGGFSWSVADACYYRAANRFMQDWAFDNSTVKYARIWVASGNAAGVFASAQFKTEVHRNYVCEADRVAQSLRRSLYQAASPTKGVGRIGDTAGTSDGIFTCISRVETTSTSAKVLGDGTVDATAVAGMINDDIIGVAMDNEETHWTHINNIAGLVITLHDVLTAASASGSKIVTNRWFKVT